MANLFTDKNSKNLQPLVAVNMIILIVVIKLIIDQNPNWQLSTFCETEPTNYLSFPFFKGSSPKEI